MMKFIRQRFSKLGFIWFVIILTGFLGFSQESETFHFYKEKYPDAKKIRLNQDATITIKLKSGAIDITQEFVNEDLYMDESANYNSKKALQFSSFFELENVEASSFSFENGAYEENKVTDFTKKDEIDDSFYDDTQSLNFILPKLEKGSKSLIKYSEKVKNPRFLSPFYFGDFSPIINNKLTIVADKDVNLTFKTFNADSIPIDFKKEEKRNTTTYTWEIKNVNAFKYESNTPTLKKILPHVIPIITSYKQKDNQVNLANSVSDLYSWYYSLIKPLTTDTPDEALVSLVNTITAGKTTDFEKVKAIYYWTQKNIKYIAFEYALGGFIPRSANEVFQKKYGDCKDNSSILYKMLEIAHLDGHLTWIGTRRIPYEYNEVPTPMVDNHMILTYVDQDKNTYFLDATGRYLSIDYPSAFIQGKEALVAEGPDNFIIKKVPIVPAKMNAVIDTTTIFLEGENVLGSSKVSISGYNKTDVFFKLENETTDDKIKGLYNGLLRKGSNKFLIKNITETNKFDYDKNLEVAYDFSINNYSKTIGNEHYINLNLNRDFSNYKTDKDRKHDVELEHTDYFNYTTYLKIPEGYTVDYLPENIRLANDYVSASITYEVLDDKIQYTHTYSINFLTLNLDQQKAVNSLIKKIDKAFNEVVILKKS